VYNKVILQTIKELMRQISFSTKNPKHLAIMAGLALGTLTIIVSISSIYFRENRWNWRSPVIFRSPVTVEKIEPEVIYLEVEKEAEEVEEVEPEAVSEYIPSPNTLALISKHPGLSGKIKETFQDEWRMAAELIARESSFDPYAINPTSGACGLAQSLPCEKMACDLSDVECQLAWIKEYVQTRYGDLETTLAFHDAKGWY
jgi:hypothetical protein